MNDTVATMIADVRAKKAREAEELKAAQVKEQNERNRREAAVFRTDVTSMLGEELIEALEPTFTGMKMQFHAAGRDFILARKNPTGPECELFLMADALMSGNRRISNALSFIDGGFRDEFLLTIGDIAEGRR